MTIQSFFEFPLEYPNVDLKSYELLNLVVCHPSLSCLEGPSLETRMPQGSLGKQLRGWPHRYLRVIAATELLDVTTV